MTGKELDSNYSFFEIVDSPNSKSGIKLDVVKLSFEHAESMTWQELFSGFEHLYAITFSSGINFLYKALSMFDSAQVIFGCEEILSYSMQEIMALML